MLPSMTRRGTLVYVNSVPRKHPWTWALACVRSEFAMLFREVPIGGGTWDEA